MKKLLVVILFCLAFTACKKTEEPDLNALPPITQIGANILAFKIRGTAHVYSGKPIRGHMNGVSFARVSDIDTQQIIVIDASDSKYGDQLNIIVFEPNWNIQVNKEYRFSNGDKTKTEYYLGDLNKYVTKNSSGYVIFSRYDSKVVAGKFSLAAYNTSSDSVNITEGFFDVAVGK